MFLFNSIQRILRLSKDRILTTPVPAADRSRTFGRASMPNSLCCVQNSGGSNTTFTEGCSSRVHKQNPYNAIRHSHDLLNVVLKLKLMHFNLNVYCEYKIGDNGNAWYYSREKWWFDVFELERKKKKNLIAFKTSFVSVE